MAPALPDPIVERHHDTGPSALVYVLVWVALVVLATVTLFVSRAAGGGWGVALALAIASIKAVLVLAFFMHLAHGAPIHRLVIAVAVGFLVLLVAGLLSDVGTRSVAGPYIEAPDRPSAPGTTSPSP